MNRNILMTIGTCYTPNGCSPDNGGEPDGYDSTDCITGLGANALIDALYLCETESAGNPAQCI